ncbi:MAG: FecR domain-containing protein, partial [Oscillospiraceae bacterium]|nr:FecR domain-containing protein [Oscillospiraceae bacterium]
MKKKNVLNAIMVLIVAVIAISGVMAVKSLKGPAVAQPDSVVSGNQQTEQTQSAQLVVTGKSGIVTVERKGIAYEVDENTAIRSGDIIRSKVSSEITLSENGRAVITLGADTELKVTDADTLAVELAEGEIFVDRRNTAKPLAVTTEGAVFTPNGTTFTVTA